MKISTKGRYGLRAMVDLAVHSNNEHISLSSIAERQDVSISYLEQVFSSLRKAGIVSSIKGAQGGYVLSDDARNIKIGTILRALEGDLSITDEGNESQYNNMQYCIKKNVWDQINDSINRIVDSITLADLVEDYYKLNGKDNIMYYI